jgi:hypothetical protein
MTFTTVLKTLYSESVNKSIIKNRALKRLMYFPIKTNELLLDKYLKTHYNLSLKLTCKIIILKSIIEKDESKTNSFSIIVPIGY